MSKVKTLVEGYASEKEKSGTSSAVLIQENGKNVLVDPGINRESLLRSLHDNKLSPEDIDFVILTHTHLDHTALVGLFENATIYDDAETWRFDGGYGDHAGLVPGTTVKIIKTPGHELFHCSVIVEDSKLGTVAAAGDVFWWWKEEEQDLDRDSLINREDPYVKDGAALENSRKKILEIADYIIPGHGKMFRMEK